MKASMPSRAHPPHAAMNPRFSSVVSAAGRAAVAAVVPITVNLYGMSINRQYATHRGDAETRSTDDQELRVFASPRFVCDLRRYLVRSPPWIDLPAEQECRLHPFPPP